MKAVCVGLDNLNIISDEAYEQVQSVTRDAASKVIKQEGKPRMTLSEYNFEAYMRWLDSQVRSFAVWNVFEESANNREFSLQKVRFSFKNFV